MPNAVSNRRSVLIALGALLALALLVLAVVVLQKGDGNDDETVGDFHELRKSEFAAALIAAREKAGTWHYLEAQTLNGKPKGVIEGKVVWDGKQVDQASIAQGSKDGEGEFRYVDGDWYYYSPTDSPKKPWLKLDKSKSKALVEAMASEADPRRQLEIFEDPAGFEVLGVENVGVAEAVHYRVTVSVEKVREITSNPVVGNAGDQQVYDIWVDEKDQIVKWVLPTRIGAVDSEEIRTFTGYGDDIVIEVPPADQVRVAAAVTRDQQKSDKKIGSN